MLLPRQFDPITGPLPPVDPESHGQILLAITGVFTGLGIAVVLARLYVRAFMLKTVGVDDYIIIIAMVSSPVSY